MKEFSEPMHAMIQVQNGICIVKESSVEIYDFEENEVVNSHHFDDVILKCVVFQEVLIICFDNEIVQLNLNDFKELFRLDLEDEIRDICIHNDIIVLCFQNRLGKIEKNGTIILGPVDENLNLSTLSSTGEYFIAADFESKLIYFDDQFSIAKQLDYSSALEQMSENPPFPLIIKTVKDLVLIGTLNGCVLVVSPKPIYCEHSRRIRYTLIKGSHIYRVECHNYVISDIVINEGHMFISSNDRSVSHFELSTKLEFKKKYNLEMRAESLLLQDDVMFVCGVDEPFFTKINL